MALKELHRIVSKVKAHKRHLKHHAKRKTGQSQHSELRHFLQLKHEGRLLPHTGHTLGHMTKGTSGGRTAFWSMVGALGSKHILSAEQFHVLKGGDLHKLIDGCFEHGNAAYLALDHTKHHVHELLLVMNEHPEGKKNHLSQSTEVLSYIWKGHTFHHSHHR